MWFRNFCNCFKGGVWKTLEKQVGENLKCWKHFMIPVGPQMTRMPIKMLAVKTVAMRCPIGTGL
jgi:hypothetical protein